MSLSTEDLKNIGHTIETATKDKFKYGVAISYIIVWALFNWDLIYFLLFDKSTAELKIQYIKEQYLNYGFGCTLWFFIRNLTIAAFLTFIFPAVQIGLNYISRVFYKIDSETENFKTGAELIKEHKILQSDLAKALKDIDEWEQKADLFNSEILDLDNKRNELDKIATKFLEKEKDYLKQIDELNQKIIDYKLSKFNHIPGSGNHNKK